MAKVKVTLNRNVTHLQPTPRRTLRALGLGKLHSSVILPDNAATRGAIFKVAHLVSIEEVK